jgi:hypothetical protein
VRDGLLLVVFDDLADHEDDIGSQGGGSWSSSLI